MLIYWHTHKDIPLTCKTSTIVPLFVRSYCSSSVVIVIYICVCVFRHKKIMSYYEHAMPDETLDYVIGFKECLLYLGIRFSFAVTSVDALFSFWLHLISRSYCIFKSNWWSSVTWMSSFYSKLSLYLLHTLLHTPNF